MLWIRRLQIPRFDRSNLFLRRIANPSGRLAGCETAGGGMNDISGEAECKSFPTGGIANPQV